MGPPVEHRIQYLYSRWPTQEGVTVKFRLIYEGPLEASTSANRRPKEKHVIRQFLHPQLRELWRVHPAINKDALARVDDYAANYGRFGFNFAPLVTSKHGLACALDILFLRRDAPGALVHSGGDLDNRIKTLLDALRLPGEKTELAGATPQADENPFYCLLENDALITELGITTGRLLRPTREGQTLNDVLLIIQVRTLLVKPPNITYLVTEDSDHATVIDPMYDVE
jgi:hypothetical protein